MAADRLNPYSVDQDAESLGLLHPVGRALEAGQPDLFNLAELLLLFAPLPFEVSLLLHPRHPSAQPAVPLHLD